jgi:adenylate cyclase
VSETAASPTRTTLFLADDNLLVREGVQALLSAEPDLEIVGVAADHDELVAGASSAQPSVLVSDFPMPPTFQQEGIEAAREIPKRHPGTGVVVLSQFDDPDYAVALSREGAAGYAYLLRDRLSEGSTLVDAIRAVASGGSILDPRIVDDLASPVSSGGDLDETDEPLLQVIGEGTPIKAIAVARRITATAVADESERLFLTLAQGASGGSRGALRRLRMLHQAIVDREEQGESLSRLLPGGLADKIRANKPDLGETEPLDVTVLMSDIRGYSAIAERSDPARLAVQSNEHRAAMNTAVIGTRGTVMQFVGDAVMAVFSALPPSRRLMPRTQWRRPTRCTRLKTMSIDAGTLEGYPGSGSGSGCRRARSRRLCWVARNDRSIRSWATS